MPLLNRIRKFLVSKSRSQMAVEPNMAQDNCAPRKNADFSNPNGAVAAEPVVPVEEIKTRTPEFLQKSNDKEIIAGDSDINDLDAQPAIVPAKSETEIKVQFLVEVFETETTAEAKKEEPWIKVIKTDDDININKTDKEQPSKKRVSEVRTRPKQVLMPLSDFSEEDALDAFIGDILNEAIIDISQADIPTMKVT